MLHDWLNMLLKQTFFTCHSLAKHVYISRASEAVFPLSLQKMTELSKNKVRTVKRLERRSTVRQALFVNDYVEAKYPHIFKDAAAFYNELNANYPRKPDLRRCTEYKCWKNSATGKQWKTTIKPRARKSYTYHIVPYDDITLKPATQKTMQLNIELMPAPIHDQTVVQQFNSPSPPPESDPPSPPREYNPPATPQQQPLLELAEDDIQPYTPAEEIPPPIIEKIINELRLDPELSAIMDEVETEIQEQNQVQTGIQDLQDPELSAIMDEVETEIQEQNQVQTGIQDLHVSVPELEIDIPELDQIFEQDDIFW